jgi:AraC-like DNA-binding protein
VTLNCIEMTMGVPYTDGGWWRSLAVEYRTDMGDWIPVEDFSIQPGYSFEDARGERQPFETYALTFAPVTCQSLRLIGQPGGSAQFTSLARIAAYRRDLSRWNPTGLFTRPVPYVFQLIPPAVIWDLSENLAKLTGLAINFAYLEYYLDVKRYQQHMRRVRHNYQGKPDLWFLIGDSIGWKNWNRIIQSAPDEPRDQPHVVVFLNNTLGRAVAPVIANGQVMGAIETHSVVIPGAFDEAWHHTFAHEHGIDWETYLQTVQRSPQMTLEQLEGAAGLMGTIANSIANLAHRNLALERELKSAKRVRQSKAAYHTEIVRQAIDFMQENLESAVGVKEIAQAVALSIPHLDRIFAEQMGRSPGDYLIDLRLERAKEYLAHTPMSVMDVCVALGYSPSYFSRLFRTRVGCTPGEYKRHSA